MNEHNIQYKCVDVKTNEEVIKELNNYISLNCKDGKDATIFFYIQERNLGQMAYLKCEIKDGQKSYEFNMYSNIEQLNFAYDLKQRIKKELGYDVYFDVMMNILFIYFEDMNDANYRKLERMLEYFQHDEMLKIQALGLDIHKLKFDCYEAEEELKLEIKF